MLKYSVNKILSIVGPTATGKTAFALWLAERLIDENKVKGIDLISADSRQVYRELPIISGADIPTHLPPQIIVHGVGMIGIDDDWSVAHFRRFALPIIERSLAEGRLPVIVGGTGLYHRHLFNPELDQQPGPDEKLRAELQSNTVSQLQEMLVELNPDRLAMMNDSDRQNPRRLVRAIEQAHHLPSEKVEIPQSPWDVLTIGLIDSLETIEEKITQRVEERWQSGALEEVQRLVGLTNDRPALTSLGVTEIIQFLNGSVSEAEAKSLWALHEFQYAKRQLTWWKKEIDVNWFQVDQSNWLQQAYLLVSDY